MHVHIHIIFVCILQVDIEVVDLIVYELLLLAHADVC
jgi:hypothetical protein